MKFLGLMSFAKLSTGFMAYVQLLSAVPAGFICS